MDKQEAVRRYSGPDTAVTQRPAIMERVINAESANLLAPPTKFN